MPLQTCEVDGSSGYKWGASGHCYAHDGSDESKAAAKRKALNQGIAMGDIKTESMKKLDLTSAALRGALGAKEAAAAIVAGRELHVSEAISLRGGESVDDLMRLIGEAVHQAYPGGAWVDQVFTDQIVVCFYGDLERTGESVRLDWSRNTQTGEVLLNLASAVQVRRVTTYVPIGEGREGAAEARRLRELLLLPQDKRMPSTAALEARARTLLLSRDGLDDVPHLRGQIVALTGDDLRAELYGLELSES